MSSAVRLVILAAFLFAFAHSAEAAPAPDGSYLSSCKSVRATARVVTARCQTRRGNYVNARLAAYRTCRGDIANDNGRLICREPDLTLYEHERYRGRALFIDNDLAAMPRSFNDRTSSIRVHRGTWQVCEDENYNGRCIIVRRDMIDLARLGFGDRISSARRVQAAPQGSYRESCRNVQFDGRTLTADCRRRGSRYETSSLDVRRCAIGADILNERGALVCERGEPIPERNVERPVPPKPERVVERPEPPKPERVVEKPKAPEPPRLRGSNERPAAEPEEPDEADEAPVEISPKPMVAQRKTTEVPSGSYKQTCRSLKVMAGTLAGECKAKNGIWRSTALILRNCAPERDIANENGALVCIEPKPVAPPAPPSPPSSPAMSAPASPSSPAAPPSPPAPTSPPPATPQQPTSNTTAPPGTSTGNP